MRKLFGKVFNKIFSEIGETLAYASQKEQVDYVLRGVAAGSFVAFFLSENKLGAIVLLLFSLWAKKCNSKRRNR
jgi:hypothetical protein